MARLLARAPPARLSALQLLRLVETALAPAPPSQDPPPPARAPAPAAPPPRAAPAPPRAKAFPAAAAQEGTAGTFSCRECRRTCRADATDALMHECAGEAPRPGTGGPRPETLDRRPENGKRKTENPKPKT